MSGRLAENVLFFARALRTAGIPIGSDKVLDAVRCLPRAGLDSRAGWHASLSALFLTRREQQAVFDEAFGAFWRDPALDERQMALMLPQVRGRMAGLADRARPRVAEALLPGATRRPPTEDRRDEVQVDASLTFASDERLRRVDFEKMSADEWHAARRMIERMRLPFPERATRRHEASRRGGIDLAATLRRMAREGGDLGRIARRAPRRRAPPLVVLCDISGSMHRYSRMLLHFVHAVARSRGAITTFLFGTRLTNVSRQLRHRDVDDAVAAVCAAVPDWAGGTRIGASLREFNFRWSRRVLSQNACVLLVTDGLDREDAGELALEMARLHRSANRIVWLNPLLRYEGFLPTASGIAAMRPHVDAFLPVHNLESLEDLAAALA